MDNEARETAENAGNFEFESNHLSNDGSSNRRWRKVTGATAVTLVVILTLVLAAHGSGAFSPGTAASTAISSGTTSAPAQAMQATTGIQSSPAPILTPPGNLLEPIPARCPSSTTATAAAAISEISYYDDPAYGQSPVWVLGLSSEQNQRVVHIESYPPLPYTSHGWRWRILVVSAPGYNGDVTLAGEQTAGSTGAKSTLFMDVGAGPAAQLLLNASQPIMRGLEWAEWPIYVYLPGSGCYQLGAHWPGGSWSISFAAGV